jgi:hypothetical protein
VQYLHRFILFERKYFIMAEYSFIPEQLVAVDENILFLNGDRCCKKGYVLHNDSSGVFRLKGVCKNCSYKAVYKVQFQANVAIADAADGGVLEPITIAIVQNGEVLRNAIFTVTPAAIGDVWGVNISALIELPCGCCDQITIRNISETTAINATNVNIIFERVA